MRAWLTLILAAGAAASASGPSQKADAPPPASTGFVRAGELVQEAIARRELPGAVLLVGRDGRIVYRKAFGNRALTPSVEPMTPDTIFDLASLTKVVATTTSILILVEEGRLRLLDRVAAFVPGFGRYGKDDITIRDLLTHMSGLRAGLDLAQDWNGYEAAIDLAAAEVPQADRGRRFIYSDINFVLLGDIVARVSGRGLDRFAAERIFAPLAMRETMFKPSDRLRPRIAPTESCLPLGWPCGAPGSTMLRGVVHDPTARRMGGVSGHAGLFGTADDLARFAGMLLSGGSLEGTRILAPLTVARMTQVSTPPEEPNRRGLGWDIDSVLASASGDLFPVGSFGHTGFTGTSLWLDPLTRTFVVLLSNRLHPDGKGDVVALRTRIASVLAAAVGVAEIPPDRLREAKFDRTDFGPAGTPPPRPGEPVLSGIDVLAAEGFARLKGKRVGLVTNQTGRARSGASTIDLLHAAPDVRLTALFSPEHGIRGLLDSQVPSSRDEKTGLPIHSLYGETRRPTAAMLDDLDLLVVDLQDVGARFYTYVTTMAYVMEEASRRRLPVMVLDRPNPINGVAVEGPRQDEVARGFTGYFPMPIRHGLTIAELARLFNEENRIGADLAVVAMRGWRRDMWFDDTGLPWTNPSPNMRNLLQATLYPGVGAIEGTNVSVGRGTDTPFEQIGAPWIDGVRLAAELNARRLAGVSFYPVTFTPTSSQYAGQACQGAFLVVTDRRTIRPVRIGVEIAAALQRLHGDRFDLPAAGPLLGSRAAIEAIRASEDPERVSAAWEADEAAWRQLSAKYLLYRN
jgi:uncharacterized protein YbbC (DUF1343 family)/CubicO group peptidase (beta-lactamase class C family)